jgi:flagellar biosynthesis chaperone FliJ
MGPKFSLQSVLNFRHSRVEALEMEFGKLNEARQQGIAMQAACQQSINQVYQQLEKEQSGDMDLFSIRHLRYDAQSFKEQLDQINHALQILEDQIEAKRLEIVAARQGEETLNTLKQKDIKAWKADQVVAENRLQDNVYIAQAFRRTNGSANV